MYHCILCKRLIELHERHECTGPQPAASDSKLCASLGCTKLCAPGGTECAAHAAFVEDWKRATGAIEPNEIDAFGVRGRKIAVDGRGAYLEPLPLRERLEAALAKHGVPEDRRAVFRTLFREARDEGVREGEQHRTRRRIVEEIG